MIKSTKAFVLSIVLTVLIFSCGKETQSSTQGGGLFKIRYTITPPLQIGGTSISDNSFQTICPTPGFAGINIVWHGNTASTSLASIETNEYSVTKGQNITSGTALGNQMNPICHTVKIEGLINGKVFQTFTKDLGFSSLSPMVKCKDFDQNSVNFIIP
jgi:hypothetical protein